MGKKTKNALLGFQHICKSGKRFHRRFSNTHRDGQHVSTEQAQGSAVAKQTRKAGLALHHQTMFSPSFILASGELALSINFV